MDDLGLDVIANHDVAAARHGADGVEAGAGRLGHNLSVGCGHDGGGDVEGVRVMGECSSAILDGDAGG